MMPSENVGLTIPIFNVGSALGADLLILYEQIMFGQIDAADATLYLPPLNNGVADSKFYTLAVNSPGRIIPKPGSPGFPTRKIIFVYIIIKESTSLT